MKLANYIKELQDLLEEHGDLDLYTSSDDEGNSYNKVFCSPEIRYLAASENKWRPDHLDDGDDRCEDEQYTRVILL